MVPGPPASGRRFVEGPESSGNAAPPSNPGYDSEVAQPSTRRKRGRSPGGLGDSRSLYSAAPPPALSPLDPGLALWADRQTVTLGE